MKLGDIIELEIEKLTYGGDGLGRFGDEKFVVFVKGSLPQDKLKVKITSLNKKFARADIVETISSPNRKKPICALYNACGSCNLGICDYEYLISQKTLMLKEIFPDTDIAPVKKSPQIEGYRHKVQFPARETKNSKRVLLGYFRENSHELTNIKFCPLHPPIINEIAQFIRGNYTLGCYSEKTHKGLLKNVLARISSSNGDILLTFVLNSDKYKNELSDFAKNLAEHFPSIKGIFVNLNPQKTNCILGETTIKIQGEDYIIEKLNNKSYKIGAVSFFQVNPKSAINLFDVVKNNIKENSTVLDAYGGVGAIGIWVSDKASKITLVEENTNAVNMASDNFKLNNITNYEVFEGDAKIHFDNFQKEKRSFDYVILDPPRTGCDKIGLKTISTLTNNIIYVSCNPQTLRRDMSYLKEEGFELKSLTGVDLFPLTHHIESVAVFEKNFVR